MTRTLAAALLVAVLPGQAAAQALLPDSPLTTLLQPQRLDRSRPLLPQERAATPRTPGQAGPNGTPCERPSAAGSPAPSFGGSPGRASGGGAGPGEYTRYMPGAAAPSGTATVRSALTPTSPAGAAPASGTGTPAGGANRPLYGGNDRPLWATGESRAASAATKPATAKTSADGEAANSTPAPVGALPRDRPLWADGSAIATPAPGTASSVGGGPGLVAIPCNAASAPLVR